MVDVPTTKNESFNAYMTEILKSNMVEWFIQNQKIFCLSYKSMLCKLF